MRNDPPIQIEYSDRFKKDLKRLSKKFRRIRTDFDAFIALLQTGETPGDQIQGTGYTVYKARIRSRDLPKGKSGSFRVIYYVKRADRLLLVTTYAKSEYSDVPHDTIKRIIDEYESQHSD